MLSVCRPPCAKVMSGRVSDCRDVPSPCKCRGPSSKPPWPWLPNRRRQGGWPEMFSDLLLLFGSELSPLPKPVLLAPSQLLSTCSLIVLEVSAMVPAKQVSAWAEMFSDLLLLFGSE